MDLREFVDFQWPAVQCNAVGILSDEPYWP